jgi:hypothetical protein
MRTIVWVIDSISRFKNLPNEITLSLYPIVNNALFIDEHQMNIDALWAIGYFSDT